MKKSKHIGYRPTWAEIDLANLGHNFRQIKKLLSKDCLVMATVKADAYGHGLIPVANKLISCGVDYLGVASIDEGIRLRRAGVRLPVLILGIVLPQDIGPLFRYKLTPTVSSEDFSAVLNRKAKKSGIVINVHVKIDTGMGRAGVLHHEAVDFIKKICAYKFIRMEGIFTHFAFADQDKRFTSNQIGLFDKLIKEIKREGINFPLTHAANSAGVLDYKHGHFNMVRPGLVLYGLKPKDEIFNVSLKPVLSLKTKVVFLKQVPKGFGISYHHTYVTKKETTIAILPIGYGDGYPRNLSNVASVLINGKRFKMRGRICMDQIVVDVGSEKVKVGDEVVLIGAQGKEQITAEELARLSQTISYEIVCGLGSRIPRVYLD